MESRHKIFAATICCTIILHVCWISPFVIAEYCFEDNECVKVIDCHLHTGTWKTMTHTFQDQLRSALPWFLRLFAPMIFTNALSQYGISSEMHKANVDHVVVVAVYAPNSVGVTTNEFVKDMGTDEISYMVSADIASWSNDPIVSLDEELFALSTAIDEGGIGIKLAPAHTFVPLNDRRHLLVFQ